jgi:hypothetical protein
MPGTIESQAARLVKGRRARMGKILHRHAPALSKRRAEIWSSRSALRNEMHVLRLPSPDRGMTVPTSG